MKRILVIGASGRIGSKIAKDLEKNNSGHEIILSSSKNSTAEKWKAEGKKSCGA